MNRTLTIVTTMLAACLWAAAPANAEPTLVSAKITFLPTIDDKDTDTKVTVSIGTKFNNNFELVLASLNDFAGSVTWEDKSGKEYPYDLKVAGGIKLSQLSGDLKTAISINPVGNDTVKFKYRLVLTFKDAADASAQPTELKQDSDEITLSQDNRSWHN